MTLKKFLVGFLVAFMLIFLWLVFKPGMKNLNAPVRPTQSPVPTPDATPSATLSPEQGFQENGNLVYKDGEWFLVYEEPGAPALTLRLKITEDSKCFLGEGTKGCDLYQVKSGARVTVSGVPSEETLTVTELRLQNNEN